VRPTFAFVVLDCQHAGQKASNVTSLTNIPATEAQSDHQLVDHTRSVFESPILVERWTRGIAVTWEGRHNQVEGKILSGGVLLSEDLQHAEKLEEAACELCISFSALDSCLPWVLPGQPWRNVIGTASGFSENSAAKWMV